MDIYEKRNVLATLEGAIENLQVAEWGVTPDSAQWEALKDAQLALGEAYQTIDAVPNECLTMEEVQARVESMRDNMDSTDPVHV
ncbi:MAG: hypothetical protein WAO78_13945, partial [Roseovarius sp.]